jgi:hypothetical protein
VTEEKCKRCEWWKKAQEPGVKRNERYTFLTLVFDVDRAREIVADGRAAVVISPDSLHRNISAVQMDKTDEAHSYHGSVLIDGHHGGMRALREGRPFFVYILGQEESLEVILEAPYSLP